MIDRSLEQVIGTSHHVKGCGECESTSPSLMSDIRNHIGSELAEVDRLIQRSVASSYVEVRKLSENAAAMGGKRLRPILVLLAAKAACRPQRSLSQTSDLHAIAASVELVHAASLVHDDVMDSALERRHRPTIVSQAGNSSAVLLGDYLFTRAYGLAASCRSNVVARRIADASAQLCEGELRQQVTAGDWRLSMRDYRSILEQKTGVLCGVSCRLGGWCAGVDRAGQRALGQFGMLLGLAFQIFDDWLDFWGTEQVGKTLGRDLAQSKPTLPLLRLLKTMPDRERESLLNILRRGGDAEGTFKLVRQQLDASDASHYTLGVARRCASRAATALEGLPPSKEKTLLLAVAEFSVARQT